MRKRFFAFWAILILAAAAAMADDAKVKAAQQSAEEWIKLIDEADYAESWEEASPLFKQSITKAQWVDQVKAAREPLGKLGSRQLIDGSYTTQAKGAPAGEYVVLQYKTAFEKMPEATEVISFTLSNDEKWRAVGYLIQ